ncbi:hypothetical protein MJ572_19625 [Escherichia coli]|nr:hypothetical protein MJ572_19625 [Escherichia coli]
MQTQHEDLWQITNQSYSGWKSTYRTHRPGAPLAFGPFMGAASTPEMGRAIRIVGLLSSPGCSSFSSCVQWAK